MEQEKKRMWTFWIKMSRHRDLDRKYPRIDQNIMKYPTQGQES